MPHDMSLSTTSPVIEVKAISKRFGNFTAVDDVSLSIHRGEVFGLIGHNGAGKSTLFKMMLGLLAPTGGQIRISGELVMGSNARTVRQRIGYLPENVALWDNLSGLETLNFFARLKGLDTAECATLLERVGLGHAGERPVRAYSKGMRQRLGFAQALLGKPQVLFLDEPTTGLDPRAIHFFWDTLAELRAQGLTIVLTSHILAELQHRVDRVAVMANGRVEALGSLHTLREQFELPLQIEVQLKVPPSEASIAQLRACLPEHFAHLPWQHSPQMGTLTLSVPRQQKMAMLEQLLAASHLVADISVEEPSLEDMFFSDPKEQHA
ncbi:MAG: ABC transporter ATP-binding protein [Lautropia sp.]|nr:ABC transporter ATP-binding protein [Lautropia sp.]